jgi:multiple sugar transport system substrate-binding protein
MKLGASVPILLSLLLSGCELLPSRPREVAESQTIRIRLWTQDHWIGITGRETDGMSLDDPRRAHYTRKDWYLKTAREFQRAHPEPKVEFEIETLDWNSGGQKLDIAVAAGRPPDIMISTSATTLKFARFALLEPLDPYLTLEDRTDFAEFLSLSEVQGKHYFLPFIGGNRYIVANRVLFRERGVEHMLPQKGDRTWTFDAFLRAARATTFDRDGDGRVDVYGFALPFYRSSPSIDQGPFFWGHGASFFDPTGSRVVVDTPEGARALQFLVDLEHRHHVLPPGSSGMRSSDLDDLWNQGRLAMRTGSHSSKLGFERALKNGVIKPGTVEIYPVMFPHAPGHRPRVFVVADSPCIFRQRDPVKKRVVIAFTKFLTDRQHIREVARALSTLPTRRSALDVWEDDPYQQYVLRVTPYGTRDAIQPYGVTLRDMFNASMQGAMSLQVTPRQALDEFAARANRFIERQERRRSRLRS